MQGLTALDYSMAVCLSASSLQFVIQALDCLILNEANFSLICLLLCSSLPVELYWIFAVCLQNERWKRQVEIQVISLNAQIVTKNLIVKALYYKCGIATNLCLHCRGSFSSITQQKETEGISVLQNMNGTLTPLEINVSEHFCLHSCKREVDCTSCKAKNSFSTPNNFSHGFWCNEIVIIVARFLNLKMLSVPNIKRCLSTSVFARKLFFTCTPLRHYWPTGESNLHWFFERKICFCLKQEPELPGIIENVTLVNFLCHSHLYVPLGPRVNFITGRNGSKSLKGVIFISDYYTHYK